MSVRDVLEERVAPLRVAHPALRWERAEQWHVTLRFLGRVADEAAVLADLETAGKATAPFTLALEGGGAFARPARATVFYAGVTGDVDALRTLAMAVDDDERPFRPHVTLARRSRPGDLRELVRAFGPAAVGDPFVVTELVLMASETGPAGARHTRVARVPLGR